MHLEPKLYRRQIDNYGRNRPVLGRPFEPQLPNLNPLNLDGFAADRDRLGLSVCFQLLCQTFVDGGGDGARVDQKVQSGLTSDRASDDDGKSFVHLEGDIRIWRR